MNYLLTAAIRRLKQYNNDVIYDTFWRWRCDHAVVHTFHMLLLYFTYSFSLSFDDDDVDDDGGHILHMYCISKVYLSDAYA